MNKFEKQQSINQSIQHTQRSKPTQVEKNSKL